MLLLKNRNRTMARKKKLRCLVREPSPVKTQDIKNKRSVKVASLLAVILVIIFANYTSDMSYFNDFKTTYQEQYNTIVHGNPDYCHSSIESEKLFGHIRSQLFNQDKAMARLEFLFRNDSNLISIAIVGSSGIGKTHFATLLTEYFPWRENIQHYVWSTYEPIETKIQTIEDYLTNLSNCGQNLIILDDLMPKDYEIIRNYYQKTEKTVRESSKQNKKSLKLIVIYLIHINSYSVMDTLNYENNLEFLDKFNEIKTIKLRQFNVNDLNLCIRHDIKSLNLTLSESEYTDLVNSINVNQSGCKNVYSKVKLYAKLD